MPKSRRSVFPGDGLHGAGVDGFLHGGLVFRGGVAVCLRLAVGIDLAGITMDSPWCSSYSTPSMVMRPTPSKQVTKASPPDSWVLISSSLSKANRVTLTALFCTSVRLTTWPG